MYAPLKRPQDVSDGKPVKQATNHPKTRQKRAGFSALCTCAHTHACRKNRACAFLAGFRVVCCLFYRFPVRNALRASQAVLITDVMVNARILAVIQIVAAPRRGPLLVELMGLEPMTNELEVHCSSNWATTPIWADNVELIFDLTPSRDFCEFFYAVMDDIWAGHVTDVMVNVVADSSIKKCHKAIFMI